MCHFRRFHRYFSRAGYAQRVKIQALNPVLHPRTKRPADWQQGAADAVTVGIGSAAGAFYGPAAGTLGGGIAGFASEQAVKGTYFAQNASKLAQRQAVVGMASGLSASGLMVAIHGLNPLIGMAVGAAVGGLAAALLPGRAENPYKEHWQNLESTEVPELWKEGITGEGVGIAVLDTGLAGHEALQGRVVAFHDFTENRQEQHDVHHHGTAMSGIIAGHGKGGKFPGVAPNAHLIGLKIADSAGKVHMDKLPEAIRWAVENKQRYDIKILNMSFTGEASDDPEELARINEAVEEATRAGLIVVAAAGNTGPEPTAMLAPASAPSAIAVASEDVDGARRSISPFSQRSRPGEAHAHVTAPGSDWLQPVGAKGYITESGTSQAAAALSGVVALWKQAVPDLTAEQARDALQHSALPIDGEAVEAQGNGSVRAQAGLELLQKK